MRTDRPPLRVMLSQLTYLVLTVVLPMGDDFFKTVRRRSNGGRLEGPAFLPARRSPLPCVTGSPRKSQSNHITVLHAGSWLLIGMCAVYIELEVRKLVKHGYVMIYQKTLLLAHAPFIIATLCKPSSKGAPREAGWGLRCPQERGPRHAKGCQSTPLLPARLPRAQ